MLTTLAIRDVVLIDRLALAFPAGLSVLTGETGAGKSILLDALGLALGVRADSALVRAAAPDNRAQVTAEFEVGPDHPALALIAAQGLAPPEGGEPLVLRRTVTADGRSRAWISDQPVGAALMRDVGAMLVEIEGQFAREGLLNPARHRDALDEFAGLGGQRDCVAACWRDWRAARDARAKAEARLEKARAEEDYLRHVAAELDALDPRPNEEAGLVERRAMLMNAEKLTDALSSAIADLSGEEGAEARLGHALRILSRQAGAFAPSLEPALEALSRAADGATEAAALLHEALAALARDDDGLEQVEERLFALRAAARKHRIGVDGLAALREEFAGSLAALESSGETLESLAQAEAAAERKYHEAAARLGGTRHEAAARLDLAVASELPPLKLENARFRTAIRSLGENGWGPAGTDEVVFEVATNPGQDFGPLARIASGGELARFTLALKVVLAGANPVPTLVFDEVDAGIGGATAAAVGERLSRLADTVQVLVVTHSPQVAARGAAHWRVAKTRGSNGAVTTRVDALDTPQRREEIARMLAGAEITEEARAAAARLMGDAAP